MTPTPIHPNGIKLGKRAPVHDDRTLKLATYLAPVQLPPPPANLDLSNRVPTTGWGMMANDVHGDCTCAALGHLTQVWTDLTPSDQEVLALYARVNGGVDEGADMLTVLKTFRTHGFAHEHEHAHSFVQLKGTLNQPNGNEAFDPDEIKLSLLLFEGVYLGISLPISAQNQVGSLWAPTSGPDGQAGSWGGHAINIVAYDTSELVVVTWGALQRMTWDFLNQYADEAFAVLPQSFTKDPPVGFNMKQLETDLKAL